MNDKADPNTDAAVAKWDNIDVDIEHIGSKITLPDEPEKMPIDAAVEALKRKKKDEEQIHTVHEVIDAHPLDGAVAFVRAMQQKYGWASPVPTPGFFGPQPPQMISVKTGPGSEDYVQCPVGEFKVPGVENNIGIRPAPGDHGPVLIAYGKVRKKEQHILKELAILARHIVKEHSIYRGKAIRIQMEDDMLDMNEAPEFLRTDHVREDELVLPEAVMNVIDTSLFTPIRHTEKCREHNIPLKRGVLLCGRYGCGKTMTSVILSRVCVENGWTFILLDRSSGLHDGLELAKRYEPAVVFAEDIDRVIEERDNSANDLLNVLDGVLSKDSNVMVVLTSNFPEKIDKAMLRPGRLDAVVAVTPPDEAAVAKLVRLYGRGLIAEDANLEIIGEKLAGQIPATIREVVERSKLAMIGRGGNEVTESDLLVTADGMVGHLDLLDADSKPPDVTAGDRMVTLVQEIIEEAFVPIADDNTKEVRGRVNRAEKNLKTQISNESTRAKARHTETGEAISGVREDVKAVKKKVGG